MYAVSMLTIGLPRSHRSARYTDTLVIVGVDIVVSAAEMMVLHIQQVYLGPPVLKLDHTAPTLFFYMIKLHRMIFGLNTNTQERVLLCISCYFSTYGQQPSF